MTEDIHPAVANPYSLMTTLTDELRWFTLLDLKDAFFCVPVYKKKHKNSAFVWKNPEREEKPTYLDSPTPGIQNQPNNIQKTAGKGIGGLEKNQEWLFFSK